MARQWHGRAPKTPQSGSRNRACRRDSSPRPSASPPPAATWPGGPRAGRPRPGTTGRPSANCATSSTWIGNVMSRARLAAAQREGRHARPRRPTARPPRRWTRCTAGRKARPRCSKQLGVHLTVAGEAYVTNRAKGDQWNTLASGKVTQLPGQASCRPTSGPKAGTHRAGRRPTSSSASGRRTPATRPGPTPRSAPTCRPSPRSSPTTPTSPPRSASPPGRGGDPVPLQRGRVPRPPEAWTRPPPRPQIFMALLGEAMMTPIEDPGRPLGAGADRGDGPHREPRQERAHQVLDRPRRRRRRDARRRDQAPRPRPGRPTRSAAGRRRRQPLERLAVRGVGGQGAPRTAPGDRRLRPHRRPTCARPQRPGAGPRRLLRHRRHLLDPPAPQPLHRGDRAVRPRRTVRARRCAGRPGSNPRTPPPTEQFDALAAAQDGHRLHQPRADRGRAAPARRRPRRRRHRPRVNKPPPDDLRTDTVPELRAARDPARTSAEAARRAHATPTDSPPPATCWCTGPWSGPGTGCATPTPAPTPRRWPPPTSTAPSPATPTSCWPGHGTAPPRSSARTPTTSPASSSTLDFYVRGLLVLAPPALRGRARRPARHAARSPSPSEEADRWPTARPSCADLIADDVAAALAATGPLDAR